MKWIPHAANECIDLMVTHNPVKLVMKQILILKNSAAIKIDLCTVVGQTDLILPGGNWEVYAVSGSLWTYYVCQRQFEYFRP